MISQRTIFLAAAGLLAGAGLFLGQATGFAQSKKTLKRVPLSYTRPNSGDHMFKSYCASCHGMSGKGNGPAVEFLTVTPADLTTLAKRHQGKFPSREFVGTLRFGTTSRAHGTVDMPIWGDLLSPSRGETGVRIENLKIYVESLQE